MTKPILHKRGPETNLSLAKAKPSELIYTTDSEKLYYGGNNENLILIAKNSDLATTADAVLQHMKNVSNPHNVTKDQVGLGNVDNTSDMDKPISTATQVELDNRVKVEIVNEVKDLRSMNTPGYYLINFSGTDGGKPSELTGTLFVSQAGVRQYQLFTDAASAYKRYKTPQGGFTPWEELKFSDTVYTHPTNDGNLHVPATSTTNDGKVLKAGATAGAIAWGNLSKGEVGLGNVENFAIATEEEALAGTATDKYVTVATAQKMIDKAIAALKAELTEIIG